MILCLFDKALKFIGENRQKECKACLESAEREKAQNEANLKERRGNGNKHRNSRKTTSETKTVRT